MFVADCIASLSKHTIQSNYALKYYNNRTKKLYLSENVSLILSNQEKLKVIKYIVQELLHS